MIDKKNIKLAFIVIINLIIAISYYNDYKEASYSVLSSDLLNIVPVAQKFDNPDLYSNDLYLYDINNVKYYTPFYVQSLRFIAKFTNYDYLKAINVLNLISHFLFGIFWYLLFYKFSKNFWISFLLSILCRGIIWLPGYEIIGISGLWSMMPRTLYMVALPLPFLLLSKRFSNYIIASFLIGFIFNFHPITGLGGILMYILFVVLYVIIYRENITIKYIMLGLMFIILGMLPFLFTYFGKTSSTVSYDAQQFNEALLYRMGDSFTSPIEFVKQWFNRNAIFLFLAVPLNYFMDKNSKANKLLIIIIALLFIFPLLSVYVEQLVNNIFNLNLRMSFQLIRAQKIIMIPVYFSILFLSIGISKKMKLNKFVPYVVIFFFGLVIFSKHTFFNKIPLIGDDIVRSILPNTMSISNLPIKYTPQPKDKMAEFIHKNTSIDAVLVSNFFYRAAAKRSVILDGKGSSMLIEGNPKEFIKVSFERKHYNTLSNIEDKIEYLKKLKANYFVTKIEVENLKLIHVEGDINLYQL